MGKFLNQKPKLLTNTKTSYTLKLVLLTLLVITTSFVAQGQEIKEVNIGEFSANYNLKGGDYKFFKLRIKSDQYDGSQDLIVKAFSEDQESDPDVFISKTNERPKKSNESDWACQSFGKDICTVSPANISEGDTFYVGVRCYKKCSFKLYTSLEKEIVLTDGEQMQLQFGANTNKIFKFLVPPNSSKDELNRIKAVTITAAPFMPGMNDLTLSATTKQGSLPTSQSRKGVAAWTRGSVLRISDHKAEDWCTDCYITILVDVIDEGRYQVMAKTNVGLQKLAEGKRIDDVAYYGEMVCYKYMITEAERDLYIRVAEFSGITSVCMQPGRTPPAHYSEALYKTVSAYSSSLVISARDRKSNYTSTGIAHICVYGHLTATYSIQVNEVETNMIYKPLEDGFQETDEVSGNEILTFLYQVPPLDYSKEDIMVQFQLMTLSGDQPLMVAAYCTGGSQSLLNCANNATREQLLDPNSTRFTRAKIIGNYLQLPIDHDENQCSTQDNNDCFYSVIVIGNSNSTNYTTRFTIFGTHSQLNHQTISENDVLIDSVNLASYKHYKFSLVDAQHITNVTFKMNTLHGDADLYLSRSSNFPTKNDFEKSSLRQTGMVDQVSYDQGDLSGAYYISVFGYQYSTFNLRVKVDRKDSQSDRYPNMPILAEGMGQGSTITDILLIENYRFEIKMKQGYEKSIKVIIQHLEGQVDTFININRPATKDDYIWRTEGNQIVINPDDRNFNRDAMYFIGVSPHFQVSDFMRLFKYTYNIQYTTSTQFTYIQVMEPLKMSQGQNSVHYYRHFVNDVDSNIEVAMTIFNGDPNFFIGVDPSKKWPNVDNSDFDSRQSGQQLQGKTLQLTPVMLKSKNPSCIDTLTHEEPCALYIAILCGQECEYSLKLQYSHSAPFKLIIGQPQHDQVDQGAFKFYYITVSKNTTSDVFATLNSMSGNTDLYVKYYDYNDPKAASKWQYPTINDYSAKSVDPLNQDTIRISKKDVDSCFSTQKKDKKLGTLEEVCTFMFGIYGAPPTNISVVTPPNKFQFVVYTEMLQLINNSPHQDFVGKGEYNYYIYKANCDDCALLVSLSTFSNGDPDLYINIGDQKLPTKYNYDLKSSTSLAEVVEVNLKHGYFKQNKIKTMRGTYILGVYGHTNATYMITITSEKNPMLQLTEGTTLKNSLPDYEIGFYNYFNWQVKDIKISLDVSHGLADIYVATFNESDKKANLVQALPRSKKQTKWFLENIQPTTSSQQRELLIVTTDKNYCVQCLYIIGIVTHEKEADYSLNLQQLNANFSNSHFIKLGHLQSTHIAPGETKIYKFIIDYKAALQMQVTSTPENAVTVNVGFSEDPAKAFLIINTGKSHKLDTDSPHLKTEKLYYLIVKANQDANINILVSQNRTVIRLSDGVPVPLIYEDNIDINKYMALKVPKGDSTVKIQIKTKTSEFYPKLYYRFYEDLESQLPKITFPPAGDPGFFSTKKWDTKLGVLTFTQNFKDIKGGQAGLALALFDSQANRNSYDKAQIVVTATYSSEVIMLPEQSYIGNLYHDESFQIYKVDNMRLNKTGALIVEFAGCKGEPQFEFIQSPSHMDTPIKNEVQYIDWSGKQMAYLILPYPHPVYILVKPKTYANLARKEDGGPTTDFLIKTRFTSASHFRKETEIYLPQNGLLTYTFINSQSFNLSWGTPVLVDLGFKSEEATDVSYHIIVTTDLRARLDTICALRRDIIESYNYVEYEIQNKNFMLFDQGLPGNRYLINVLAKIKTKDAADGDSEIIPYSPIEIQLMKTSSITNIAFYLYVVAAIAFSGTAVYYWRKAKVVEQQLEYEMQDVRNIARVGGGGDYKSGSQKERYQSLVKDEDKDGDRSTILGDSFSR